MKIFLLASLCVILGACSSSDDTTATTTDITTVSGALSNINSKVDATIPNTSSVAATSLLNTRAAMTTEWITTGDQYSLGGDFGASPRDYVRNQGDEDVQGSLMYRLDQTMESLCVFSSALPSTNGVPDLSDADTITLTAADVTRIEAACSADLGDDTVGATIGYKVEDISGEAGSQYERKISFDMAGGTAFHNFAYFTLTAALSRIAFVEDSNNESVGFFEYVPADGIFKFEYSEFAGGANFRLHYRGILVEASDLGRFVAWTEKMDDIAVAVVSTEEGGGDVMHVSYSYDEVANTNDFADGSACISSVDFSIETDNTQTCDGITGVLASAFTADPDTEIGANGNNILGADETSVIQFSSLANILTAGFAY